MSRIWIKIIILNKKFFNEFISDILDFEALNMKIFRILNIIRIIVLWNELIQIKKNENEFSKENQTNAKNGKKNCDHRNQSQQK